MKKIISTLMIIAAAAISFSSCQKQEMIAPEASQEVTLTFASEKPAFADETKTEWNGETIQWSEGDKISIAYTVNGNWQNASGDASGDARLYKSEALKAAAATAQFNVSTYFKGTTEGAHVFYGVYPAPSETAFFEAPVATLTVPAIQTLKSDTFDSSADLMTGVSINDFSARPKEGETISMEWTRLVAHAFITIKTLNGATEGEKVSNIVLTAQDDANIVGMQKVNLVSNQVTKDNTKANVLNLSGGNVFVDAEGTVYVWACVLPETLTSLTVKVDTDKATYTRAITDISKTFKQNARNLLTINMSKAERVEKVVDPEESVNTGTLTFDDASKRIVSTTSQQVWSENNITLTYDKADYANNLAEYAKPVRFYKGTTITVEAPGNISVIEFACNTTAYATALNSSITGSTLNEKVVTVTLDGDARSVTYTMGAQVRMDAITVTYSNSGSGETPDTTPSITVAETLELTSAEAEGTISVTYKNLEALEAAAYSDEECTTECDWLIASWDNENDAVSYLAEENEGDERTAYIQIYALDAELNEYSKIITVTQDAYVDPSIVEKKTIAEFKALTDGDTIYELEGRISQIATAYSSQYNNISFYIVDETTGDEIQIYRMSCEGVTEPATSITVGDRITVRGAKVTYGGQSQMAQGGTYVSHEDGASTPEIVCANNTVTITADAGADIYYTTDGQIPTTSSTPYNGGFPITETKIVKAIAVVDGLLQSLVASVECEYVDPSITPTTVTAELSFASTDQRTAYSTSQQVWEQNGIKLTNDKASSTSDVGNYSNPARFYKNSTIVIEAPGNITKIVFVCSSTTYATTLKSSIADSSVSGSNVTVVLDGSSKVSDTYKMSQGQVRVKSIEVTYAN